jgi:hypothetical protein
MIPLLFAALTAFIGYSVGRSTKPSKAVVGAAAMQKQRRSAVVVLMQLVEQRLPVSPGLAVAAFKEALQRGDHAIAQQIAVVFFPPPRQQQQYQPPPPIVIGEEETQALEQTYGDAEPLKAVTTSVVHNPPGTPQALSVQDVSPDEWREFLLCFKTREPSYRGERHIGAFEQSARRLAQLGIDAAALQSEEAQYAALDKDLTSYLQSSERLLNDFTGESVDVNGQKVCVTRSGILALLKAAGPAGAKGWLTEEHQRKTFPHTTEIFVRGNGRF